MSMSGEGMRDAVFTALFDAGAYGAMTQNDLADVKANMLLTYDAMVAYLKAEAVVNVTIKTGEDANTRINTVITAGVPAPTDGGAALKTTQLVVAAVPSVEHSEGDPNSATGGIT